MAGRDPDCPFCDLPATRVLHTSPHGRAFRDAGGMTASSSRSGRGGPIALAEKIIALLDEGGEAEHAPSY